MRMKKNEISIPDRLGLGLTIVTIVPVETVGQRQRKRGGKGVFGGNTREGKAGVRR